MDAGFLGVVENGQYFMTGDLTQFHAVACREYTLPWDDERVLNLQRTMVYVFGALVRFSKTPNRTMHGNKDWDGSNHLRFTETLTESTVGQWNSSGTFSQDPIRCSSVKKSNVDTREFHRKNSIHVDVQQHFLWNERQ